MNNLTIALAFISTILSSCTSLIYAYIAFKKLKEPPKDEIWETTTKILCNRDSTDKKADEFAMLYESLKLFKDNGCSKKGILSLKFEVMDKNKDKEKTQ